MPGCILHVTGVAFDPHRVASILSLRPYQIYLKGDVRFPGSQNKKHHEFGGFKCSVSESDGVLPQEITDAINFLKSHEVDLRHIRSLPEVDSMYLDFGYNSRFDGDRCVVQFDLLPIELLKLCALIGVEIMLSLYPPAT